MRITRRRLAAVARVSCRIGDLVGVGRMGIVGDVVGDVEVEIAVQIVVGEGATGTPARIIDAGRRADVGKESAVVAET